MNYTRKSNLRKKYVPNSTPNPDPEGLEHGHLPLTTSPKSLISCLSTTDGAEIVIIFAVILFGVFRIRAEEYSSTRRMMEGGRDPCAERGTGRGGGVEKAWGRCGGGEAEAWRRRGVEKVWRMRERV
jgi:hypothetical protein